MIGSFRTHGNCPGTERPGIKERMFSGVSHREAFQVHVVRSEILQQKIFLNLLLFLHTTPFQNKKFSKFIRISLFSLFTFLLPIPRISVNFSIIFCCFVLTFLVKCLIDDEILPIKKHQRKKETKHLLKTKH